MTALAESLPMERLRRACGEEARAEAVHAILSRALYGDEYPCFAPVLVPPPDLWDAALRVTTARALRRLLGTRRSGVGLESRTVLLYLAPVFDVAMAKVALTYGVPGIAIVRHPSWGPSLLVPLRRWCFRRLREGAGRVRSDFMGAESFLWALKDREPDWWTVARRSFRALYRTTLAQGAGPRPHQATLEARLRILLLSPDWTLDELVALGRVPAELCHHGENPYRRLTTRILTHPDATAAIRAACFLPQRTHGSGGLHRTSPNDLTGRPVARFTRACAAMAALDAATITRHDPTIQRELRRWWRAEMRQRVGRLLRVSPRVLLSLCVRGAPHADWWRRQSLQRFPQETATWLAANLAEQAPFSRRLVQACMSAPQPEVRAVGLQLLATWSQPRSRRRSASPDAALGAR